MTPHMLPVAAKLEGEGDPRQEREPVVEEPGEPAYERDDQVRLLGVQQLVALQVADAPWLRRERAAERLLGVGRSGSPGRRAPRGGCLRREVAAESVDRPIEQLVFAGLKDDVAGFNVKNEAPRVEEHDSCARHVVGITESNPNVDPRCRR